MTFGSGSHVFSDIYQLDHIVRHAGMMVGRNTIIDVLREVFRRDREYHFVADKFGFPKTPSFLNLPGDAGKDDEVATRIYIGGTHREDVSFLPAITVKPTSVTSKPISFNQNKGTLVYDYQKIIASDGTQTIAKVPSKTVYAGAWKQNFEIRVISRSLEDAISISDIIMISLETTYRDDLQQNGIFIESLSSGGQSDENIGEADPVYNISVNVSTFSEWRREIPISNLVERIQLCFSFDIIPDDVPANDLAIEGVLE